MKIIGLRCSYERNIQLLLKAQRLKGKGRAVNPANSYKMSDSFGSDYIGAL